MQRKSISLKTKFVVSIDTTPLGVFSFLLDQNVKLNNRISQKDPIFILFAHINLAPNMEYLFYSVQPN